MDEGKGTRRVRGGDRGWVKLELKYQSAKGRADENGQWREENRCGRDERKRNENVQKRKRKATGPSVVTENSYACVCQRFAHSCAGALLRGCLISSSANQTPYTQNSIRSLHKRASQFGAPRMHNAPAVCSTRGRDLLYRVDGALREGEKKREWKGKIIPNSCHLIAYQSCPLLRKLKLWQPFNEYS